MLVIGVLLDPRYKLDYVSYLFEATCDNLHVQELTKVVKDTLIRLYEFYAFNINEGTSNNSSMSRQTSVEEGEKVGDDYQGSKSQSRNMKSNYKVRRQEKDCLEIKSEVDIYLLDACKDIEDESFDVLAW